MQKQEQKQVKTTRKKPKKERVTKEAEKQEFIRFVALPRPFRKQEFGYENDADFAIAKKVHPGTLSEWKKAKEFWDEVKKHWKRWGKDRTPNVIAGLYQKAVSEGNAAEALAWMKIIEDWQEKNITKVEFEELEKISEATKKIAETKYDEPTGDDTNKGTGERKIQE